MGSPTITDPAGSAPPLAPGPSISAARPELRLHIRHERPASQAKLDGELCFQAISGSLIHCDRNGPAQAPRRLPHADYTAEQPQPPGNLIGDYMLVARIVKPGSPRP
jgi:hypothetical protein